MFVSTLFSTRKFDTIIMATNQRIRANLHDNNSSPTQVSNVLEFSLEEYIMYNMVYTKKNLLYFHYHCLPPRLILNDSPVKLFTLKYFFDLFHVRPHWNALSPEKYWILNIPIFNLSIYKFEFKFSFEWKVNLTEYSHLLFPSS